MTPPFDQVRRWAHGEVAPDRREVLEVVAGWIVARVGEGAGVDLLFVCTHNARRSQLAQVWAWAAARAVGLGGVRCWSGGTEATRVHPSAVSVLASHGFTILETGEVQGPGNLVYEVGAEPGGEAVRLFSKVIGDPHNPREGFLAVMVCSDADEACPFVPGAAARVALPYVDPGAADGTPQADAVYLARSAQIGCELAWTMARAALLIGPESSRD